MTKKKAVQESENMRTEHEIRARIAEILMDDRLAGGPALVMVNAPLALIQMEGEAVVQALRWVIGEKPRCALSYPTRIEETRVAKPTPRPSLKGRKT